MFVERDIEKRFGKVASAYNIIALVGARQAGKTTFLREQTKRMNSSYVLFDDPDARGLFEEDIKKFEKQYIEGFDVSVLDEVQYCKGAGTKLKYLADTGKKAWITASSEMILSKDILSFLVGRVSILKLYPFSLNEFLAARKQKSLTPAILKRAVWEHLIFGGYPKVVLTQDVETKKIILKDLYSTMIFKDIAGTFSINDIGSLEQFSKYLAVNTGTALSYESISKQMNISFQTVKRYLDAMEKSYLVARVPPYHTNKTKEITKQPKLYFVDTGLRNSIVDNFGSEPDGRLFENYVLSELIKAGFSPKYWRTKSKAEVDFIVEKNSKLIPIEVKLNAKPNKVGKSLRSFIETYKPKEGFVITYKETKGIAKINGCKITFTNAFELKEKLNKP